MSPSTAPTLFWLLATLGLLVALAFVLPPLLRKRTPPDQGARRQINVAVYRDQLRELDTDRANGLLAEAQYQQTRREIEARLADDALSGEAANPASAAGGRALAYALGVLFPALAVGIYLAVGNPDALDLAKPDPAKPAGMMSKHDIMKMVQRAEAKVRANPDDAETWSMLARSYAALQRWPEAWKSYQIASRLRPDDAGLLAGQAEALAVLKGGALEGESMRLVHEALKLDPDHPKGLELAAAYAFQQRNFAGAAAILERLKSKLDAQDPFAREVEAAIARARQLAAATGRAGAPQASAPAPTAGAIIRGTIDIAPAIRKRLQPQDTIFLFARPLQGGPPVAAVRGPATQFPMDFELSDRWAMNPENPLSRHKQVVVVARISKSGTPMGQAGDLEGSVSDVRVGTQDVRVVIDKVLP